jgi:hypothetical protein
MGPLSSSKEETMTDRWFSEHELAQLSRPTMDRAVEAIDAGEADEARRLCLEMKHEWQMLHDLMASGVLDLVSFIQQRNGAYEGLPDGGGTREAHDWSYGRKGFPLYCTHCSFMNESMPIQWSGYPLYPSEPPEDYSSDPCTWYWYKDPDEIPERHWQRYGAKKPGGRAPAARNE